MPDIPKNIDKVRRRIDQAALNSTSNSSEIKLLAVSKRHNTNSITAAYQYGLTEFGENYVQEALDKIEALKDLKIFWHFIGPIQSNKTKAIAENFDWVHTIDRMKIATRLSNQRPLRLSPLNICIQVNIDNEINKSGVAFDDVLPLAKDIAKLPRLALRGLMCIPQKMHKGETQTSFKKMKSLFDEVRSTINLPHWDTLSMGMSSDLEPAIANGANIVRIGTDIFGARE